MKNLFKKKQKAYGQAPKVRTIDQINGDYNQHALQYVQKSRLILILNEEIEQHMSRILSLHNEAAALPKKEATPPAAPAVPDATAPAVTA